MLEADSFDCSTTFRVPSTINEITEADVNEVTQGQWNNLKCITTGTPCETHQPCLHLKVPSPRSDKAKAFCPIEKTPPVSPGAQSTQVLHMQALNLLQDLQVAEESTVRKPMLVKILDQPMDQSGSSTAPTQRQPVTPVSFASTTQVKMDMVVPPTIKSDTTPGLSCMGTPFTNHKCSKHG